MLIFKNITLYKCEYCRKPYQLQRFAEAHEKICTKNPDNDRRCFGCKFMKKKEVEYFFDSGYGEDSRMVEILHCSKLNSFMYPPKVEHKQNYYELGDELNQPMKKECEFYDDMPF